MFRFANLEFSPPGFFVDEASSAVTAICLREVGEGEKGLRYPLFFPTASTYWPPTQIYPAALWSAIFGTSIVSFRALPAFLTTLTLIGLYLLAYRFIGADGALVTLFAGSLSSWGFQFSRVAWEVRMLPMLSIWGSYFFLRSNRVADHGVAGVLLALALYAYAPARLFVPLLVVLLLLFKKREMGLDVKGLAVFGLLFTASVFLLPTTSCSRTSWIASSRWVSSLKTISSDSANPPRGSCSSPLPRTS